jgi:hypothetical protein
MVPNLSRQDSGSQSQGNRKPRPPQAKQAGPGKSQSVPPSPPPPANNGSTPAPQPEKKKNYYFDNKAVEALMTDYVKGGCTDVTLRDKIMENAGELIRQIIRTHKLHLIGAGKDGTTFYDLFQIAWVQIESSLYKFNYGPGHTKVFNMWSQVAKTVMLAHIKKESRDRRNYGNYKDHLGHRERISNPKFERFIEEAVQLCQYNDGHLLIIQALQSLAKDDPRPHEGLISKLVEHSRQPRSKVVAFLRLIRLRGLEFSDSPMNDSATRTRIKPTDESDDDLD